MHATCGPPAGLRGAGPEVASVSSPAELTKNPVDGFSAGLVDDSNIFEWQLTIIGPPDTL
jgi:hypothetical protein